MILLILALIWAAALLPPMLHRWMEGSPVDSVGRFRRHLRILESTSPAASSLANDPLLVRDGFGDTAFSMPSTWAAEAARLRRMRRRQQVMLVLLAAMGSTLLLGLVPGLRLLLVAHVLVDMAFAGYVWMLAKSHERNQVRTVTMFNDDRRIDDASLRQQAL